MNWIKTFVVVLGVAFYGLGAYAQSPFGSVQVDRIVGGLDEPWSIAFVPNGGFLVTERGGRLNYFDGKGGHQIVSGLPAIAVDGQGGLFDVLVPRGFEQSREIFLAYNAPNVGTSVARARLSDDHTRLENLEQFFSRQPALRADIHFGGRLIEDDRDRIFVTLGDHGRPDDAQDPSSHSGKIVMIRDGSHNKANQIYSSGHRNPQGFSVGRSGSIFATEHGAMGGDELNEIKAGRNYGWPIISYGLNYDSTPIGIGNSADGLEQPDYFWDPSIAPSGLAIYSGKLWRNLRGVYLVGSLKFDRIDVLDERFAPLGTFSDASTGRVRDIREAPDGSVWYLSVHDGAVYRVTPK